MKTVDGLFSETFCANISKSIRYQCVF